MDPTKSTSQDNLFLSKNSKINKQSNKIDKKDNLRESINFDKDKEVRLKNKQNS